jgi:putative ABC transport system substrate-binding protein
VRRRDFLGVLSGSAITLPLAVHAQQASMPVVGFLNPTSSKLYDFNAAAFRRGLQDVGYVEGENVRVEYRWAEGDYGRLPELAAELVALHVNVIGATRSNKMS